jgi:outer membrane protein assembly factor BamB
VVNDIVYIVAQDSYLYALNASNGSVRWRYKTADKGSFSPTVADGLVFMDTSDGHLLALDATTGKERWQYQAGAEANSLVTVVNGVVYGLAFADPQSLNTVIYALNASNGSQLWRNPTSTYFFMQLQVVNGVIYAVSAIDDKTSNPPNRYSYVFAFDAKNGSELWRSAIIHEYVPAPPEVVNGVLYLGSDELGLEGPHVYALNTSNGTIIWKKAVAGAVNSSPQVVDGVIYIGQTSNASNGNNNIVALNAADGSTRWTHPLPNYLDFGTSPVVNNGSIYVCTVDGIIHVLKTSNGAQLRTYTFGSDRFFPFQPAVSLAP